uniref:U3 small nucleolar RNAinteracting protein 2like [Takifugu rubripes] n=1 Tax=Lepeophtheirus salmonis TaxID=72036 RepID=A0A0K2VDQ6_LEPSM
MRSLSQLGLS